MLEQCLGELLGTMMLVVFANGVAANTFLTDAKGQEGGWMAITTGTFIAVVMGVFVAKFAGSENADINPAISMAKYFMHIYPLSQTILFSLAQLAGAFIGAIIVWLAYLPHWQRTADPQIKLLTFCTIPAIRAYPYNFLCEAIATAVLIIGATAILGMTLAEQFPVKGLGPYLVGILVWGIGFSLGGPTGYAINPARDLGPRIAHALLPITGKGNSDWAYAWVPVFGPFFGSIFAAGAILVIQLLKT